MKGKPKYKKGYKIFRGYNSTVEICQVPTEKDPLYVVCVDNDLYVRTESELERMEELAKIDPKRPTKYDY